MSENDNIKKKKKAKALYHERSSLPHMVWEIRVEQQLDIILGHWIRMAPMHRTVETTRREKKKKSITYAT